MKIPLTPSGFETVTFRIVAQHLNHCATAVPIILTNQTFPLHVMDKVFDQHFKVYLTHMCVAHVLLLGKVILRTKLIFNSISEGKTGPVLDAEEGLWVSEILAALFVNLGTRW